MTDVQSCTFARRLHLFLFILKAQIKEKDRVRVTEPFSPPQSLGSQSVSAHGELFSFLRTIKTEMAPR